MTHVVVDPVTRIEGHLRIEAEVDGGAVQDAWSSSTMFRGIETILKGRDPRDAWAFTQRICGVCTTVHAITSIRAVENAIGAEPPPNARLLRNLIMASQMVQDHVADARVLLTTPAFLDDRIAVFHHAAGDRIWTISDAIGAGDILVIQRRVMGLQ